jgi:hypothetical protein
MNGQLIAVIAIITVAALYVLRAIWNSAMRAGKAGCASGCGKCSAPTTNEGRSGMIPLEQVGKNSR